MGFVILISIIVPVYNTEKYIEQCIHSLVNQTYQDIEIIVVNDGSSDNSENIIKTLQNTDNRIHLITQENQGLSGARNTGLSASHGQYIMFVDSDDWLDKNACYKLLQVAEKNYSDVVLFPYKREYPNNSKETCLFYNDFRFVDDSFIKLRRRFVGLTNEELARPEIIDNIVTAWGKLYKRSVIQGIHFVNTKDIGTEDLLYNVQLFWNVKSAFYLSDVFYHYRKDDMSSLTHCYKEDLVYRWQNLYGLIEKELNEHQVTPDFYEALSNRICFGLIGLGLNLAEDRGMKHSEKVRELRKILSMEHYRNALNKLPIHHLSAKWRPFFFYAKHRQANSMLAMLSIMNRIRKN